MFTFFFTQAVEREGEGEDEEIHGGCPYPIARTSTAAKPIPTAAHCAGRSRSWRTRTPSAMVTSGLMK